MRKDSLESDESVADAVESREQSRTRSRSMGTRNGDAKLRSSQKSLHKHDRPDESLIWESLVEKI